MFHIECHTLSPWHISLYGKSLFKELWRETAGVRKTPGYEPYKRMAANLHGILISALDGRALCPILLLVRNEDEAGWIPQQFWKGGKQKTLSLLLLETSMIVQPLFNYRILTELPSKQEATVPLECIKRAFKHSCRFFFFLPKSSRYAADTSID